jgi:hypothetical protein
VAPPTGAGERVGLRGDERITYNTKFVRSGTPAMFCSPDPRKRKKTQQKQSMTKTKQCVIIIPNNSSSSQHGFSYSKLWKTKRTHRKKNRTKEVKKC